MVRKVFVGIFIDHGFTIKVSNKVRIVFLVGRDKSVLNFRGIKALMPVNEVMSLALFNHRSQKLY